MGTVDRRTFLSDLTLMAATAAVPAHARGEPPAGLPAEEGRSSTTGTLRWSAAPCTLCGVGCGLLVGTEPGRAVAVTGDPQAVMNKGLACAKGYHAVEALYSSDRITRAMVRRGGALVSVPITEALDLVARRLRETIAQHGPDHVALYGSAQWSMTDAYVASKLFKGGIGTNNVDTSSRLYNSAATYAMQSTFGLDGMLGCAEDLDRADVFVIWDTNLAESDPVVFSRMLDRRRANPAVRIIELATRTTRTSYAADRSVLHAPHSALAIANGVCQQLIARRLVRRDFVQRHVAFRRARLTAADGETLTDEQSVDTTWDALVSFLADYAPDRVQNMTGMDAESIQWLASIYGDPARRVVSVWGAPLNQSARGIFTNNALYNIHLLTGKIATPGNSAWALPDQPNGGNSVHDAGALAHTLPAGDVRDPIARRKAATIWNVPAERISATPGLTALSMFRALDQGRLQFLWIQATNPMMSLPNIDRYRRAAGSTDRFVVVTEAYPTPTTEIADVVLPAALWLEREGVYGNPERRLQHVAPLVSPPGDAASDGVHMIEIAKRLGMGALFPWERQRVAENAWTELQRFHDDARSMLPSFADLRRGPGLQWPMVDGRETRWRCNPEYDPAATRGRGTHDFYGHADGRAWVWLRAHEDPAESPTTEYPFWLLTGPVLEHWGGGALTQRIPALHRSLPLAYVEVNADDAARLGIRYGDTVRVRSRRGTLELAARIDYRAQPPRGVVFVPTFDETRPANRLTLDTQCPVSGQTGAGACAVRLERASGGTS